jgi:hypothetical protein
MNGLNYIYPNITSPAFAFIICFDLICSPNSIAVRLDLVGDPSGCKTQRDGTPLISGPTIFLLVVTSFTLVWFLVLGCQGGLAAFNPVSILRIITVPLMGMSSIILIYQHVKKSKARLNSTTPI